MVALSTLLPFAVQANTDIDQQDTNEPVQKLKTIVVSAALKEQDVDKAPASISVITSEDIERSAALSLADVFTKNKLGFITITVAKIKSLYGEC